jgi:hypothetical protein
VPWIIAGAALVLAVLAVLWRSGSLRPSAAPDMANAGNAGSAGSAPGLPGRAPDISSMSPQERFDRLWDRVIRAAEAGDSATVRQFSPMALGAYSMMDSTTNDLRFHVALIQLATGDFAAAQALADTIQQTAPGHLFGYVILGEVAERQNQAAALSTAYRNFLSHYDAELGKARPEYAEHKPILDDFRIRATASGKR